jgi:siroheme synthase
VIENGTTEKQKCVVSTVEGITEASEGMGSPAIIIVGETVSLRDKLRWFDV